MKRAVLATALSLGLLWSRPSSADALELRGELGFSHRALYRVPIEMLSLDGMFGGRIANLAYAIPVGFEWGRTLEGLSVLQGRLGFLLERVVGRARFGAGGGIGILSISRVTRADAIARAFFEGVLRVSADIVRFGEPRAISEDGATTSPALFVVSEFRMSSAQIWGPSLFLGVRY